MKPRAWLLSVLWLLAAALPGWAQTDSSSDDKPASGDPIETRLRRATVFIRTTLPKAGAEMHGSGVLINRTGLVLTNNHVVDPNHNKSRQERLAIALAGGKVNHSAVLDKMADDEKEYQAVVVHQNEPCDVAVIQLQDEDGNPPSTPNFLTFVPDGSLRTGMKIKTMGFPGEKEVNRPPTLTLGLITQFMRTQSGFVSKIQTDATVVPGNSGGPVIEASGQLIGIVSLLEFGEGTKNKCGVVPGHLIKQFILGAFQQGRMPEKTDILPFLDLFADENDIFRLPGKDRVANAAVLHRADGTIRQCTLTTDKLTLPTTLGRLEVPTNALAYLIVQDGTGHALFDGGDQLAFPVTGLSLAVKIDNKSEQVKLAETSLIAFPLRSKPLPLLPGNGTILQTADGCRIGLAEIKGEMTVGGTRCPLAGVTLIESDENGKRTVSTVKGERLRGDIGDQLISARTAWSAKPIQIRMAGVEQATLRPIAWPFVHARGRRLVERLPDLDADLKKIAELLDGPDWQKARPLIEARSKVASPSLEAGKQFRLLKAVEVLRTGDLAAAKEAFSKFPKDQLVAQSYARVLERYPDGVFLGDKLSEPDVLWRASTGEAKRILASIAKDLADATKRLEDAEKLETDAKLATALKKLESEVDIANQLEIGIGQPALVQVLLNQYTCQYKRFLALNDEHEEAVNMLRGASSRGSFQAHLRKVRGIEGQMKQIQREAERVIGRLKVEAAGFKLESPEFKEAPDE